MSDQVTSPIVPKQTDTHAMPFVRYYLAQATSEARLAIDYNELSDIARADHCIRQCWRDLVQLHNILTDLGVLKA